MSIAERIQLLRLKAGLSQSDLAEAAGLSVRSLQQWEQGARVPKTLAALALARALGVGVEQLLEGKGADKPAGKQATDKGPKVRGGGKKGTRGQGKRETGGTVEGDKP